MRMSAMLLEAYSVFGRVTPEQKRLLIEALNVPVTPWR